MIFNQLFYTDRVYVFIECIQGDYYMCEMVGRTYTGMTSLIVLNLLKSSVI